MNIEQFLLFNISLWKFKLYINKAVLETRVSPAFAIKYFYNHFNTSPTPMSIHERMWIQWHYFSKLNQKVNYSKMTFDPTSVEVSCVTLPKDHFIQVPWKYVKICGYTVTFFSKTWTKGHGPLDDLWPQVCWGHMCDATQGSLCPSSMGIHQCMWIQWSILQNSTHIYILHTMYILHTTYILRTQWVIT